MLATKKARGLRRTNRGPDMTKLIASRRSVIKGAAALGAGIAFLPRGLRA
jgi:hypothetical protein